MPHLYLSRITRLLFSLYVCFFIPVAAYSADSQVARALQAPELKAVPSLAGAISLTWTPVTGATQYTVQFTRTAGTGYTTLKTLTADVTNYRHTNLGPGEKLYYRIRATGGGETVYSKEVAATTHPANYTFRIMPFGDSNTEGGDTFSVPVPDRIAYRRDLYRMFITGNYKVDFVGSESSGSNFNAAFKAKYGFDLDLDHAGYGGYKNSDLLNLLKNGKNGSGPYLDVYKPDIMLVHTGTNGLGYPTIIQELEGILNEVDAYEARSGKEVTVVLASLIKQCTNCPASDEEKYWGAYYTERYNADIVQLANSRIAAGDRLIYVDMSNGAGINYTSGTTGGDMEDFLHPNQKGYDKMAPVWFNALKDQLLVTDNSAPETQIVSGPPASSTSRTATFTFASNESGVTYQVSLNGAAYSTVSNPATLNNLPDGNHTLSVRAVDAAGNIDPTPATHTWTIDATPPAAPVIATITDDTGVDKSDLITTDNTLKLSGTAEAGSDVTITLSGKGTIGTATANTSGTWSYSYENTTLAEGKHTFTATAKDAAGNTSAVSKNFVVTIDRTAPTVQITTTAASPVKGSFTVTIKFSEKIDGLAASDFTITNGSLGAISTSDNITHTATVTPTADGQVSLLLAAGKVTDIAGNGNTASNKLEVVSDITPPKVTISTQAPALVNAAFDITIAFTEAVTGFEAKDITITNGTISDFKAAGGNNYTAKVNPTAQGEVTIRIAADVAFDVADNGNQASNTLKLNYDSVAPAGYTIAFGVSQVNTTNSTNVPLQVSNAEVGTTYNYSISSSKGTDKVTGSAQVTEKGFTISGLDLSKLEDGTLTATFYLTDAAGNKGETVTAQVEKLSKDIVSVKPSATITVPFKTEFSEIALPQKVEVSYKTGETGYLNVAWQKGNYNGSVPGNYNLKGNLELEPGTTNTGNRTGTITIVVEPNQAPTALQFSTTTFRPDAGPTDVIGTFTTTDPDDEEFTYSLVSGEGDAANDFFRISNNELYLVTNNGLSGIKDFSVRVQSRDPYNNTIERVFVLTKTLYKPNGKIELVNAFSPDGDGINDTWTVPELRFYDEVEITVFDRAGNKLFYSTDPEKGWDGKLQNGSIKQGAYFYMIRIKDIDLEQKGVLTVL